MQWRGFVLQSDAFGNGTWVAPGTILSDERLKSDITPLRGVLDGIGELDPVTYRYRQDADINRPLDADVHYGFMAQDLAKAFPHAVRESAGYLEVINRELDGILIAAARELRDENIELRNETKRLAAELADLKAANLELSRDLHSLTAETAELKRGMTTVLKHLEAGKRIQATEH